VFITAAWMSFLGSAIPSFIRHTTIYINTAGLFISYLDVATSKGKVVPVLN
jgi:hypothetical protein